ncbi:MAG: MOSC domain-containing protein [Oleiphilaceae bacterium]|nr:MOSC domain-containing protein [Oleiphilaceae bacterium]
MSLRVQSLFYYPVKSLQSVSVNAIDLDEFGPRYDRRFMFVSEDGTFVTQRQEPALSQWSASFDGDCLVLKHADQSWQFPLSSFSVSMPVKVWGDGVLGLKTDRDLREISEKLCRKVNLVYMPDSCFRQVDRAFFASDQRVSFADGFPILLTNTASLEDLNERLKHPVEMWRFRPNLVVEGAEPYEEDGWSEIQIGEIHLRVVKPCSRCVMTTIDQHGQKGKEPLATLATYRKNDFGVCFGQNLVQLSQGNIRVGDEVKIIA